MTETNWGKKTCWENGEANPVLSVPFELRAELEDQGQLFSTCLELIM